VVAVLLEKQFTVPDTYPLSLNALAAGCNQKTARSPVMSVGEDEILTAIDGLKSLSLVFEGSSSRVPASSKTCPRAWRAKPVRGAAVHAAVAWAADGGGTAPEHGAAARICRYLVGRGVPGRAGRTRSCPGREAAPWPGEREHRWTHLLCGEVSLAEAPGPRASASIEIAPSELEALRISHRELEDKVARLQALVEEMAEQLGISIDPDRLS
jgi:uncharacterized protein YceH (UPF0502 family)